MPRKAKAEKTGVKTKAKSTRKTKRKSKKQTGTGLYDSLVNKLTGSNLKDGERHPLLWVDGKLQPGQYMGPGSKVYEKTKAGVEGISESDRISHRHDLAYSLANSYDDIRAADLHMLDRIRAVEKAGTDNRWNTTLAKAGIWSKVKLEDMGVSPERFTSFGDVSDSDRPIMQAKMDELTQKGYGKKTQKTKGLNPWLAHVQSVRKKNKGKSYKECLKIASKSYRK